MKVRESCFHMKHMKVGTVALIGRPNVGKSTLVNTVNSWRIFALLRFARDSRYLLALIKEDVR